MTKKIPCARNLKITLVLLILVLGFKPAYTHSVTTFNTYKDYIREKGVDQGEYIKYKVKGLGKVTLILEKNEKKVKVDLRDIWGFEYKGRLFRVFRGLYPAMLVDEGTMNYYENGLAHLEMLSKDKMTGEFSNGAYSLFSFGLDGELVACPKQTMASQPYKHFKKFRKAHPEYEDVLNCIEENNFQYRDVQQCIRQYNKSVGD